jgi:hypothetical protein
VAVCTIPDVLAMFRTRWAAARGTTVFSGTSFASLWFDRRPGVGQNYPFASLRVVEADERSRESDAQAVVTFDADLSAWTNESDPDLSGYARALEAMFDGKPSNGFRGGLAAPSGSAVMSCTARPGSLSLSKETIQGNDVVSVVGKWRVIVGTTEG